METGEILYIIRGVAMMIGLLCGECLFKACDEHQQRKQSLLDRIRCKLLAPKITDATTPEFSHQVQIGPEMDLAN